MWLSGAEQLLSSCHHRSIGVRKNIKMKWKIKPAFFLFAVFTFCSLHVSSGRFIDENSERRGTYTKIATCFMVAYA